jgi:hypothetical protein
MLALWTGSLSVEPGLGHLQATPSRKCKTITWTITTVKYPHKIVRSNFPELPMYTTNHSDIYVLTVEPREA